MNRADLMLDDAVLVVAHPDDEVLWFSSILRQVARVVIAFRDYSAVPDLGARRAAALAKLPYRDLVCLAIPEAGSLDLADWSNPTLTHSGLALDPVAEGGAALGRYEANYAALCAALRPHLAGRRNVFAHNPWGEYGHEDHVQVFRAVDALRREFGYRQWSTNYCSTHAATLAARFATAETAPVWRGVDQSAAQSIADIYKRHGCWTWRQDWTWPGEECVLAMPLRPAAAGAAGQGLPLTIVPSTGDPAQSRRIRQTP